MTMKRRTLFSCIAGLFAGKAVVKSEPAPVILKRPGFTYAGRMPAREALMRQLEALEVRSWCYDEQPESRDVFRDPEAVKALQRLMVDYASGRPVQRKS